MPVIRVTAAHAALMRAVATFRACLSKNGVKLPAGAPRALSLRGVDTKSASYRRALATCRPVLIAALRSTAKSPPSSASSPAPRTAPTASSIKVPAFITATMRSFTRCMRTHGVPAFPDPKGASFDLSGTNLDTHAPAYRSAEAKCNHILQALDQTH